MGAEGMDTDEERARALIECVVLGDLSPDDLDVVRALAAYPALRRELTELQRAQNLLDATARLEQSTLAAARTGEGAPADIVGQLRRLASSSRRSTARPWLFGLAAAIALLGVAWWMHSASVPTPGPQPRSVLGPPVEILACVRAAKGFTLTWSDKAAAAHYKVLVVGAHLDLVSEQVYESQWNFSAESAAGWPHEVTFTVQSYNDAGVVVGQSRPKTVAWPP